MLHALYTKTFIKKRKKKLRSVEVLSSSLSIKKTVNVSYRGIKLMSYTSKRK